MHWHYYECRQVRARRLSFYHITKVSYQNSPIEIHPGGAVDSNSQRRQWRQSATVAARLAGWPGVLGSPARSRRKRVYRKNKRHRKRFGFITAKVSGTRRTSRRERLTRRVRVAPASRTGRLRLSTSESCVTHGRAFGRTPGADALLALLRSVKLTTSPHEKSALTFGKSRSPAAEGLPAGAGLKYPSSSLTAAGLLAPECHPENQRNRPGSPQTR